MDGQQIEQRIFITDHLNERQITGLQEGEHYNLDGSAENMMIHQTSIPNISNHINPDDDNLLDDQDQHLLDTLNNNPLNQHLDSSFPPATEVHQL